jgi:pectate lyase
MKFSALSLGLVAGLAIAAPTPTVEAVKRASVSDKAFGYASQNGGTSGGAGGTTTTVSTYAQFTKAVVIVSGPINTAPAQVKVGSKISIIGKSSAAKLTGFGL